MAYCTLEDLKKKISYEELIQLTDDDDMGDIDTEKVAAAIADADAEIDSYCARRYKVPFTSVPPLIRKASVAIAIYNLFAFRQGAPDDRKAAYDNTRAWLNKVADGKATVGVQPVPEPPEDSGYSGGNRISTRGKIFSPETMDTY